MSNYRIVTSFIPYTPSVTSQDSAFPVTNLSSYQFHPYRPWKSSSNAGTVDLTLDFGVGNTIAGLSSDPTLFLDIVNVSSVRIQANGSLSWGSPPWNTTAPIARNPLSDKRRGFFRLADLSASVASHRYLNIRIDSRAPNSGYQYQIGTGLVGTTQEMLANPLYPARRRIIEPTIINKFSDGGFEVLKMGENGTHLSLNVQAVGSAELDETLGIGQLGITYPFIVWDSVASGSQYAYLMRQSEAREWIESVMDQHDSTWTMVEVQ
jgi:hypothetical protein